MRIRWPALTHTLLWALLVAGLPAAVLSSGPTIAQTDDPTGLPQEAITDELLVRTQPHMGQARALSAPRTGPGLRSQGWQRVKIPDGMDLDEALEWQRQQVGVVHVEPNYRVKLVSVLPDDPALYEQWALGTNVNRATPSGDINAPPAWARTTGSREIVVALLDSGVDLGHEDLAANIWVNPTPQAPDTCPTPDSGQACYPGDQNGWNFIDNKPDPTDDHGHGTHVAGIVGAVGNNGIGVAGINWEVSLMPLKFLDERGNGRISDVIDAIHYAVDNGAHVINASYSTPGESVAEREAIEYARDAGVLFVAAGGNDRRNLDERPIYPAAHQLENVIAVGSSTRNGTLSSTSNTGPNTLHLAAPGEGILSTWPKGISCAGNTDASYCLVSGTSMSAPMVTGAAALLWSQMDMDDPTTWRRVRERILTTTRTEGGAHHTLTGGILDLDRLLNADPATLPPIQPTHLEVRSGDS
ncbi:MAG: hypothetical protein EA372_11250, partial [Chromatiaceae bacterium]